MKNKILLATLVFMVFFVTIAIANPVFAENKIGITTVAPLTGGTVSADIDQKTVTLTLSKDKNACSTPN